MGEHELVNPAPCVAVAADIATSGCFAGPASWWKHAILVQSQPSERPWQKRPIHCKQRLRAAAGHTTRFAYDLSCKHLERTFTDEEKMTCLKNCCRRWMGDRGRRYPIPVQIINFSCTVAYFYKLVAL